MARAGLYRVIPDGSRPSGGMNNVMNWQKRPKELWPAAKSNSDAWLRLPPPARQRTLRFPCPPATGCRAHSPPPAANSTLAPRTAPEDFSRSDKAWTSAWPTPAGLGGIRHAAALVIVVRDIPGQLRHSADPTAPLIQSLVGNKPSCLKLIECAQHFEPTPLLWRPTLGPVHPPYGSRT